MENVGEICRVVHQHSDILGRGPCKSVCTVASSLTSPENGPRRLVLAAAGWWRVGPELFMVCLRGLGMLGQLSLDGAFQEVRVKVTRLPSDDLTSDVPELTSVALFWLSEPLIFLNSNNRENDPTYLHGGLCRGSDQDIYSHPLS